jgi:hypothetical protein
MRRKLVFWTAFNSYQSSKLLRGKPEGAVHPITTAAWTERRIELFKRYNLPSILNQSHEDFLYAVLLDPLLRRLTEPALPLADDRVLYCYEDEPTLSILKEYDEIILALIDSDDMYSRHAGRLMMDCPAEWMYFKYGYAYYEKTGKLWAYDTIGVGPFFAHRMSPRIIDRFDRDKRHPTHKAVAEMKPEKLADGNFCVLLHEKNTSSNPLMRYVLRKPVDRTILARDFGMKKTDIERYGE